MRLTLSEVAAAIAAERRGEAGEPLLTGVAVDSRVVRPGDLFFALPGERTDGHRFVTAAAAAGAAAAVVERPLPDPVPVPLLQVQNTLSALAALGHHHLERHPVPVVAVTGSVGKTTTRDLIAAALLPLGPVLRPPGNYNTEIGLPLALCGLGPEHRVAVLEMGMRGRGQIARLATIAPPRIGVVTVIGETHIELLGSIEAIVAAKAELVVALPPDGWAVLNGDDPRQADFPQRTGAHVLRYGLSHDADFRAVELDLQPEGSRFLLVTPDRRLPVSLSLPGEHHVRDALAALAVAHLLGVDLEAAARSLADARPGGSRWRQIALSGRRIIDDTYNASPLSVRAAIAALARFPGRRLALLGEMAELGDWSREAHRGVGAAVAEAGLDWLGVVGEGAEGIAAGARAAGYDRRRIESFRSNDEAAARLVETVEPGATVLIKGSRAAGMESIVQALVSAWKGEGGGLGG